MNIHVPRSKQTVTEMRLITNAMMRLASPATSKIAIIAKQDTLMGSYLVTSKDIMVDWKDAMDLLMTTSIGIDHNLPKNTKINGRYIWSKIIGDKINISKKKDDGDYALRVHNGVATHGVFGKPEIGNIIQKMWITYGNQATKVYIDDLQHLILQWLANYGFTVGIKDLIVPNTVHEKIEQSIETKRKEIMGAITEYENDPYSMSADAFEQSIKAGLQSLQDTLLKIVFSEIDKNSGAVIAGSSGSSGTTLNTTHIVGAIGQTILEGDKRIPKQFNNRTLPMFYQHDDSPYARGYCINSFLKGLSVPEFFFQVMAGRDGTINTAIKTAETGYFQRKLIKILEDIKVEYDGTVRNANDKIIQYNYGDSGINTESQVEQNIQLMVLNNKLIRDRYVYSDSELKTLNTEKYTTQHNNALYKKLIQMRDKMRKSQKMTNLTDIDFTETYKLPVDLQLFITNIINQVSRSNKKTVDPYYVLGAIKDMYSGPTAKIMKYDYTKSKIKKRDELITKLLLKFYLYDTLSPKRCTHEYKLSKDEFDTIVTYFRRRLIISRVEGGEMVGFIAAQSVGEPVTQTNLKSFHKAGTGMTVSLGLPRVKEVASVTKNIKTPIQTMILDESISHDKNMAIKIASFLRYTVIKDVIDRAETYYDPTPSNKNSLMNRDGLDNVFTISKNKGGCQKEIDNLPWVIRLTLSKEKLIARGVSMLEIKTSFCHNWSNRYNDLKGPKKDHKKIYDKINACSIVSNYDNSDVPMIHIRYSSSNYSLNTLIKFQEIITDTYKIKGLSGINDSKNIKEETYVDFDEEGNVVKKKRFIIMTEGVNITDITRIQGIDLNKTFCNDIVAIYEKYGIEAARSAFIREFTIAVESSGAKSNYQHIELLADAVSHMGYLIPINRHGANKLDTDPFSRGAFERTVEQFLGAAAFCEVDHMRSVSARIMAGMMINGGTGAFDLFINHDKIKAYAPAKSKKTNIGKSIVKKNTIIQDLIAKKKAK